MNKNAGFTLIELLVVILIIGILSAVALPQYQKTVLKSRTSEAWTNLSALHTAVKLYCLENPDGDYVSLEDLAVEVKNSKKFPLSSRCCLFYWKVQRFREISGK